MKKTIGKLKIRKGTSKAGNPYHFISGYLWKQTSIDTIKENKSLWELNSYKKRIIPVSIVEDTAEGATMDYKLMIGNENEPSPNSNLPNTTFEEI